MPELNFAFCDYEKIAASLNTGKLSSAELTHIYLRNIQNSGPVNAFISLFAHEATRKAEEIDRHRHDGNPAKLAGLVLAVKDNICMQQAQTTCGSRILRNYRSPYTATVIQRLAAEDVIFLGKTNMDEFAMGSSNEHSAFAAVHNPHDLHCVPGGSSGGSAAAVAAGCCTAALGSDTGGSIRQPASFCGVLGLKPTYGRVSRYGLVAFASSLDQIGPIARSAADCAAILQVIAGPDPSDATCSRTAIPDYASFLNRDVKGLRIGLPQEYFVSGIEAPVRTALQDAASMLKSAGAELIDVSLPHTDYAIAAYYIIATAEASANLARFDGARYGSRSPGAQSLDDLYINSRTAGFGPEVKRRIMLGTFVLSSGYYDAYYGQAQKVRTLLRQDFTRAFEQTDLLLAPTCPTTAFAIGEKTDDPLTMYLSDVYTVSVNLAGLPAISMPCGKDPRGLPIGLQLIGKPFDEGTLLRVTDFLQRHHRPSAAEEYILPAGLYQAKVGSR